MALSWTALRSGFRRDWLWRAVRAPAAGQRHRKLYQGGTFDATVLQALKETEQSLTVYGAELDRRQALAELQNRAQKAFELANDQFLAGALTNLDLLTTEQFLISADASVAASDAALVQDQISLFKALGGGWHRTSAAAYPK